MKARERASLASNARNAQAWLLMGGVHGTQARWKAQQGQGRDEDFEQAARAFEKALELEPESFEARLDWGDLLHAWSVWKKDAGRAPTPPVERGLALVEEVLSSCPEWPRALLLRAKLGTIRAGTEAHADAQQLWRAQASEDLSRAFTKNPHLKVGWKP